MKALLMKRDEAVEAALTCVGISQSVIERAKLWIELHEESLETGEERLERRHLDGWALALPRTRSLEASLEKLEAWRFRNTTFMGFHGVVAGQVCATYFHAASALAELALETLNRMDDWLQSFPPNNPWASHLDSDDDCRIEAYKAISRIAAEHQNALEIQAGLESKDKDQMWVTAHHLRVTKNMPYPQIAIEVGFTKKHLKGDERRAFQTCCRRNWKRLQLDPPK